MDMHFQGVIFQTHAEELERRLRHEFPPTVVLDVRPAADYAEGHIPGARSASASDLSRGLPTGVEPATEIIVVGEGPRDPLLRRASLALRAAGARRIVEFPGGMSEWTAASRPVDTGAFRAA